MVGWAEDLSSVIREARRHCDTVVLVGHSFGGQALGLLAADGRPDAAVLVNAQSGWWGHWRGGRRVFMWGLWHVLMPGLTKAMGYFPGKRVSAMEDLPAGVALQWSRWGRHRDYICRDPWMPAGYAAVRCPVLSFSFSDDALAPKGAVDALASWFTGADVARRHVAPADVGQATMGHYGFFRAPMAEVLWPDVLDWVRQLRRAVLP